jgi:hypothetical protein
MRRFQSQMTNCSAGQSFAVFAGPTATILKHVNDVGLGSAPLAAYPLPLPDGDHVVVVCRQDYAVQDGDIAVDAIVATCK